MEEDNDSWGDLFTEYPIASSTQAEELVSILDEAKIDNFKLSVSFPAEYQQLEFNNELKMQTEGSEESTSQSSSRKFRTFLKKPEGYPKYVTMELGRDEIRSRIFVQVYREEINRIEVENNYRIFADRKKVLIYMKEGCDLNSLIKNKLFELHQQLCIYHSTDQGLIVKMSKSKKLREELEKYGITAWFRWYRRIEMGYFFSTKMDLKEIERTVGEVARFSVSLFNLQSQYLSSIEN